MLAVGKHSPRLNQYDLRSKTKGEANWAIGSRCDDSAVSANELTTGAVVRTSESLLATLIFDSGTESGLQIRLD